MTKKIWNKPALKRMVAGSAEAASNSNNEPGTGGGANTRRS
ncbi:hypothetical protein [Sphingomonas swuensis]